MKLNGNIKGLSDKEPYVLGSLVPIDILINRKPESPARAGEKSAQKREAQRVRQQRQ